MDARTSGVSGDAPAPLRVLEIGNHALFFRGAPAQTTYYWTSQKPHSRPWRRRALGPLRLIRCWAELRAGKYDLLVIHAMHYAPWHPRSLLTTLRSWHWRAPLGLFALFAWRFIHLFHRTPIAVVDLGDHAGIGRHNFHLLDVAQAYFKRELPADGWLAFYKTGHPDMPSARWRRKARQRRWLAKLKPLSYGTFVGLEKPYAGAEKTADIFFVGDVAANHSARAAGLEELKALQREGYVVDLPQARMSKGRFARRMSAAHLAWSPAGLGWDCSRHYEAALVGTAPLINYPSIQQDLPLRDGETCVYYSLEPGGLARAARAALADKPRLARMGKAAAAFVRRHHTWRARADRVAFIACGRRLDGRAEDPDAAPAEDALAAE